MVEKLSDNLCLSQKFYWLLFIFSSFLYVSVHPEVRMNILRTFLCDYLQLCRNRISYTRAFSCGIDDLGYQDDVALILSLFF